MGDSKSRLSYYVNINLDYVDKTVVNKNVIILATVVAVSVKVISSLEVDVAVPEEYEVKKTSAGRISRSIASNRPLIRDSYNPYAAVSAQPDFRIGSKNQNAFTNENTVSESADQDPDDAADPQAIAANDPESSAPSYSSGGRSPANSRANIEAGTSKKDASTSAVNPGVTYTSSGGFPISQAPPTVEKIPVDEPFEPSAPTPVDTLNLTCSANVGEGTYGAPQSVGLSCSTASAIKFCVSENTCCDPVSSGLSYSAPVTLGTEAKTYCMSYIGYSTDGSESPVYQKMYTFNPTLPSLSVAHSKIFYQTTQLSGLGLITSSQFGTPDISVGQINYKSHDPGTSGLNLTCEQLITDYSTFSTPTPVVTLAAYDVSALTPSDQIEVNLPLTKLDYGNNFIASYAQNANFADKNSCSTTLVVLNDFEYFSSEISHGDAGTATVREFSGGFSPYGFFEDSSQVYRGPAGVGIENQTGQELHTGFFSLFF